MQLRHPWIVAAAILLQALGLAIFWEWFNGLAFGQNGLGYGLWKTILVGAFLGLWAGMVPSWMEKNFGASKADYRLRDTLAGLPLAFLPLLIPLKPLFTALAKPFPMKLTAFTWMPWWGKGLVIAPEAFAVLTAAGVLILAAFAGKVVIALMAARRQHDKATPGRLFVLGFAAYLLILSWPAIVSAPQAGEVSQLLVLQSIAFDSSFTIERVLGRAEFYQFHPVQEIHYNGFTDSLSRLYLPVSPGMPLLYMAFYLTQGRWLASLLAMLFAAGAAAQLYGLCRDQNSSSRAGFLVWMITLAGAPLMLYGYQLYEVTAAAFFMIWGVRMALRIGMPGVKEIPAAAAAGLASGLLWLGSPRLIVPALVLFWLTLHQSRRAGKTDAALFSGVIMAVPALCAIGFYLTFFQIFMRHPVYDFHWPWEPAAWKNLLGVFADRYAGLLWNAPVWLAGLAGSLWLWFAEQGKRRVLAAAILIPVLASLAFAMIFPDVHADGSSLNRYLAPMLPLLGVGLAVFLDSLRDSDRWSKMIVIAGAWGAAVALAQAVFPFLTQEAARMKLAELVKALGWVYSFLPSLSANAGVADWLFGGVLACAAAYLVYDGMSALAGRKAE